MLNLNIYSSINDQSVINLFFSQDKLISSRLRKSFLEKYPDIYNYILNRFNDSKSLAETLYRIKEHIEIRPVCVVCGGEALFVPKHRFLRGRNGNPFLTHCSTKCAANDEKMKEQRKRTNILKYGVDNPAKAQVIKDKASNTCQKRYGASCYSKTQECKEKIKNTCIKKYGTEYYFQSKDCKEKTKQYCHKFGVEYISQIDYVKKKVQNTCLNKYGVDWYTKSDQFKIDYTNTCLKKYGVKHYYLSKECKEKYQNWCIKNFGVDHYSKTVEFKNKIKSTSLNKYGVEYYFQTEEFKNNLRNHFIEKYNVNWYSKTSEWYDKTILTSLDKYGVNFYSQSDEFKNIMKNKNDEIQEKIKLTCLSKYNKTSYSQTNDFKIKTYNTKKENNTFNTSNPENVLYNYLSKIYPDIIRQYKCKRYPFSCDFYIPSKDLFIEYNGNWTHGKHPFDKNNISDSNTLKTWIDKNTKFYNNAITTWTISDPNKRKVAKENNLKYLEIWPSDWVGKNPIEEFKTVKQKIESI